MNAIAQIPRYAIYALLIFAPLARASVQPWAITVIHILTLIALTAFIIAKMWQGRFHRIKTPLDKPFALILILAMISSIFSVLPRVSLWSALLLLNYIIVFYLVLHTFRTRDEHRTLIHALLGLTAFLAVFGLFKYLGSSPFPWWEYTDIDQYTGRLTSTFGNPDHLAGWVEMTMPLALGLFLLHPTGNRLAVLLSITALCLTALILSLSRGAWFSTSLSLMFIGAMLLRDPQFHRKRMIIGIAAGTVAVLLVVLSTTEVVERIRTLTDNTTQATMEGRLKAYDGTLDMIEHKPFIGTGPGSYVYAFPRFQPPGLGTVYDYAHNDYLHVVAETGLFLVPLLLWMMLALFRKGFQKLKNRSRLVRGTTLGALAGVTALIIHSVGDFNLHMPANALLLVVLLAMAAGPVPNQSPNHSS